ncbi:MAG: hypothetical protein RTU92_07715 [Candidatus Thorarchaeota archaeon]
MNVGEIEIHPLGAESMGVRSLCTKIVTPDITLLLDPSAALSMRHSLEPHPMEYQTLMHTLQSIFVAARQADVISISHYHFDHVRPGFTDFRYTFSSLEELQRIFEGKHVIAKDNRERINPSQRRRGFYFERDVRDIVERIDWSDSKRFEFGDTTVSCSHPLPHGPDDTRLGFVIATTIEYGDKRVLFAPDVQGPVSVDTCRYILSCKPDLAIVGGPPIYLSRFLNRDREAAMNSMKTLSTSISTLIIDHHLMRNEEWSTWLQPVYHEANQAGHKVSTMAEFAGLENQCLEAKRPQLYREQPPSEVFLHWVESTDEYKQTHLPPFSE